MATPKKPYSLSWPENHTAEERVAFAAQKINKITDLIISAVTLHECNREAFYSDQLSRQIPYSHAGVAWNVFRNSMESMEIITICRIWDRPSEDRNSLPTVRKLLDHPDVHAKILHQLNTNASWRPNTSIMSDLIRTLDEIETISQSGPAKALKGYRDHYLAHSLDKPVPHKIGVARRGDERLLLEDTVKVIKVLKLALTDTDFPWDDQKTDAQNAAKELWGNCKFTIPDLFRRLPAEDITPTDTPPAQPASPAP